MRKSTIITLAAVAALATAAAPQAAAAFIGSAGTGWAPFSPDFSASLRNLKSNGSDFEIGLGPDSAAYPITADASWNDGLNTFSITYDAETRTIAVSLNDDTARWTAPAAPTELAIQLLARNKKKHTAELALSDLTLNDQPIADAQRAAAYTTASGMPGTSAPGELTWLTIADVPTTSWTLSGTLGTDWTGPAPEGGNTRIDVGFRTPEPSSMTLLALITTGLILHRRRNHD